MGINKRINDLEKAVNPTDDRTRIFVIYDTDDPNLFQLHGRPGVFTLDQVKQIEAEMGFVPTEVIYVSYDDAEDDYGQKQPGGYKRA